MCYTNLTYNISEVLQVEKMLKVLTDPVSNHILQMLRLKGKMTISDILTENNNIPRATVYRKMDKLFEVGAIYIIESHKVRGQIENCYAVKEMYISGETNDESMKVVTMSLMQILNQFDDYFRNDNTDVDRDKLFLHNYTVSLSDEDYTSMIKEIFQIVDKYLKKENKPNSKLRSLYLLSVPNGGKENE